MSKVVITSKTKMTLGYCVGGYDIDSNSYVRLLEKDGKNQPLNTQFKIGQLWDINYVLRQNLIPPHIEDVLITAKCYVNDIDDLPNYLLSIVTSGTGCVSELFDHKLCFTNNNGPYINATGLPNNSVGFWIIPKALNLVSFDGKSRYQVEGESYNFPYVGVKPPIQTISVGTLVRVSLARWWTPSCDFEKRCYMQLSGWY